MGASSSLYDLTLYLLARHLAVWGWCLGAFTWGSADWLNLIAMMLLYSTITKKSTILFEKSRKQFTIKQNFK